MLRRLFNLLTLFSLLLCIMVSALYVSSYWFTHLMYHGGWTIDGGKMRQNRLWLMWMQGRVVCGRQYQHYPARSTPREAELLREPRLSWDTGVQPPFLTPLGRIDPSPG